MSAPLVALAIVAAVVGLVVVGIRALLRVAAASRARDLAGPAATLGLMPVDSLPADLPPFQLLNTGTSREASSILRGSHHGCDVVAFDYMFIERASRRYLGLHRHNDVVTATIACAKGSWLNLPAFAIEPDASAAFKSAEAKLSEQIGDGAMGKFAHALMAVAEGVAGSQAGWRFAERPDVSYVVSSGDEAAVRSAFAPPVLDFFRAHPGWIVEGQGDWVMVTFSSQVRVPSMDMQQKRMDTGRLTPERLGELVNAAADTVDAFRGAAR